MSWLLLVLVAYVVLDAIAQGKLTRITREYVPPTAQEAVNVPLHRIYPICYALLALVVAVATHSLYVAIIALFVRLAFFDIILNLTKKDPVFGVGTSATSDQIIQRIAKLLHLAPALLNALVKLVALLSAVGVYFYQ